MTRHQFVEATPLHTWTACVLVHAFDPDRQRSASHGLVCEGHWHRLTEHFAELPALAADVEQTLARSGNAGPKISGDPERALPFDERAGDALRLTRDTLASWASVVVEEHPSHLHPPRFALEAVSAFLGRHLAWVCEQPWVDDLHREFGDVRHALIRAQTTARTRIVPLGVCEIPLSCDVHTHEVTCCDGTLRAFVSTEDHDQDAKPIVCSGCGTEHQPATWRALSRRLRKDAEPMLTYAQLSHLLRVPIGTLRYWASEDDWRRLEGRPGRYHQDDAQTSFTTRGHEEKTA